MTEMPSPLPPPGGGDAHSGRLPLQLSSGPSTSCSPTNNPSQLGFPHHSNSATSSATSSSAFDTSSAAMAHPDERLPPASGNHGAANPNLGFQPPNPTLGQFPKISSNFDKVESRQPQAQSPTPSAVSAPICRTTQTNDGAAAAPLGFQTPSQKSRHETPVMPNNDKPQAAQTFAEIAARKTAKPPDLFTHGLSAILPVMDSDGVTIFMPQPLYEQRLLLFQFALIGRIFLPPGSSPSSNEVYKAELSKSFQTSGDWNLLHLGKGYFSLQFRLQEDQLRAARRKSWQLSTGSIHLREWQPNFDPYKESSSTAQLWVRLFHLPTEYWHPEFLVGIFRSVGNVIKLDGNTAQGLVGHFARALVEVDLSKPLLESVRVGLPDNLFFVDFSYENIPLLCSFCQYIGHSIDQCRKAQVAHADGGDNDEGKHKHDTAPARKKKKWVAIEREQQQSKRIVPVGTVIEKVEQEKVQTSNSFDALHNLDSETVPETQYAAGDIMDMVTGGSSLSQDLTKQLTTARNCAMNRQLRSEREDTGAAAHNGTPTVGSVDSDSGEEMEAQPSLTPNASVAPAAPYKNTPSDQNEAGNVSFAQVEADLQSSSKMQDVVAADLHVAVLHGPALRQDMVVEESAVAVPAELEAAASALEGQAAQQQKGSAKVAKRSKRKAKEVPPTTRQLRSSRKTGPNPEASSDATQAIAVQHCQSVQVPVDPMQAQMEAILRAAAELGRRPSAYVLDTGQSGPLQAMDFIDRQQWEDSSGAENLEVSDDYD